MSNRQTYQEASGLIRSGRPAEAADLARACLDTNPTDEIALSILGSALMKLDSLDDALAAFEQAVAAHPASFAAHGDLGFARMTSGRKHEAIAAFEKAVELNDTFYQGWCYLGRLQFEVSETRQAQAAFGKAAACDPFADRYRDIQSAMSASRFAAAEKIAREMLARQPGHPAASYALAHLASTVGAFEEAAQILAVAIDNFPCDQNLRSALISSLEEVGDYARALREAELAAGIDPDNPARWLTIGRIHGHSGRYEDSLAAYDRALSRTGNNEPGIDNLQLLRGHILKILGRYDESVLAYRASAAGQRDNGAAWWGLADLKIHRFSDSDLAEMRKLADDETVKPAQRCQAAFSLGKALEDRRDFAGAFRWYALANAIRPDVSFKPEDFSALIDETIAAFTPEMLEKRAPADDAGPRPIFIVGLPRSGSTLIEQILASHSDIEGTMELVNLPNLVRRIRIDGGKRKASYPQSLSGFDENELAAYGRGYIEETAIYRSGLPYFIDKMPTNFDKVGLIHMVLPSAIVIDARRHPADCGLSCFKQHFAGGHHFSYALENIGHYYNGYLKLMDHWNRVLPGKVLCVQYEQLVQHTEDVVKAILEHCGVRFEASCLRFFENRRPVRTPSSEQVRQPVYRGGVGYWKNFEAELSPLADALGPATLDRFKNL